MDYMGEQYFQMKNTVIKYERYLLKVGSEWIGLAALKVPFDASSLCLCLSLSLWDGVFVNVLPLCYVKFAYKYVFGRELGDQTFKTGSNNQVG